MVLLCSKSWIKPCVSKTLVVSKEQVIIGVGVTRVGLFRGNESGLCSDPKASVFAGFVGIDGASLG